MAKRSQQLQVRVTPGEKAALRRLARQAGQDMSTYVLARALPSARRRFAELVAALRSEPDSRYVFAELNDLLAGLAAGELREAVEDADLSGLSSYHQNYLAAMVEHTSQARRVVPPAWVRSVAPLREPRFAAPLAGLRPLLLRDSPVAFKRRNLFVDATVGDRV